MERDIIRMLSIMQTITGGNYLNDFDIRSMDPEVNDCLIKMYCFMMVNESDPRHDELFQSFQIAYHNLNIEQQEYVKEDFEKIIKAQDEHEKVKRKGEIKYE